MGLSQDERRLAALEHEEESLRWAAQGELANAARQAAFASMLASVWLMEDAASRGLS